MNRFVIPLLGCAVLIGAGSGYTALQPCSASTQRVRALGLPVGAASCPAPIAAAAAAEAPPAPPPPAVTVATADRREFVDRLFVSGTLVPRDEAEVAARIDGLTIVKLDAEDGDWVKAGQVLARLDRTQLDALLAENDAAIKRADAAIEQAKSNIAQAGVQVKWTSDDFERAQKLAGGVMSVSTIEQRETAMKTAQAQLAGASNALSVAEADRKARDAERQELEVRIGRTDVTAPVAGLVSRRSAKLGATASGAGEPLFRIIADGAVDLEADVPEQWLSRFAIGMPASIRLPGVKDPAPGASGSSRRKSTGQAAPARSASPSRTCRTPISAPSPRPRSSSCVARGSARRPPPSSATATSLVFSWCATA